MKEQNKILSIKNKFLLFLIVGFVVLLALGVKTYAASNGPFVATYDGRELYYYTGDFMIPCDSTKYNGRYMGIDFNFEYEDDVVGFVYVYDNTLYVCSFSKVDSNSFIKSIYYTDGTDPMSSGSLLFLDGKHNGTYDTHLVDTTFYPHVTDMDAYIEVCRDYYENVYEPPIEVPDFDSLEKNSEFCLKSFGADNSILATWDGTVTDEYENEVSYVVAYLGYAYKEQPDTIVSYLLYNKKVFVTDNHFYIPWDEVQSNDENMFLRYVEFIPYGKTNPDKVFYPYIKGCSAYVYFDDSGSIDSVKIPISVDKDSLTTNIIGGSFDSSIPVLSDVIRVDNGFADVMSSYSQSSTIKWSTVFSDSNYYVQVRTTFRYKLNADKVWSEVTVDTSVPTGRFSCLVDDRSFTYTYGDYAPLFWKQDNNIWTDDDLDRQGNLQPIRDSIRIVRIDNGVVSYGPWTTLTLKNGIWETGEVTGSYESDYLEEDNTGGSIVEDDEVNSNFLTDFDFSDISGVWDAFIGIFKNLFSFLGQFPELFSRIFSFLPYEIRSMIYVSMVAICVLGLVKAVIK